MGGLRDATLAGVVLMVVANSVMLLYASMTLRETVEGTRHAVGQLDARLRAVEERVDEVPASPEAVSAAVLSFPLAEYKRPVRGPPAPGLRGGVHGQTAPAARPAADRVAAPGQTAPPPRAQVKHLVMAAATLPAYAGATYELFVGTLRETAEYDGDVALFVAADSLDAGVKAMLRRQRVTTVSVPWEPCDGSILNGNSVCATDKVWGSSTPMALMRYRYYSQYLRQHAPYEVVLWSDVSDAFFQRNPFEDYSASPVDLLFFAEHHSAPLAQSRGPGGRAPIDDCYADAEFADAGVGAPVLTASSVMASGDAALAFLRRFTREVGVSSAARPGDCRSALNVDRALLNKLYYSGEACGDSRCAVSPYDVGPVYTASAALDAQAVSYDGDGFVLSSDGRRAPVVHEYGADTRVAALAKRLAAPGRRRAPGRAGATPDLESQGG